MAPAWVLRQPAVTTALIGASKPEQLDENVTAIRNLDCNPDELAQIEKTLVS
jgi:L-glyceraldehyde 3-phosphate reductase